MAKDDIDKCSKAYRQSAAFKRASFHPPDEIWSIFSDTEGFVDVIHVFKALVDSLTLEQDLHGLEFYQVLKSKLTSWKCQSLWDLLNSRLKCKEYKHENVAVGKNIKCIVVGAGPIGLRTAIEMSMLGCRTIVVEKRKDFTRNNVLHLWPFLLHDFRTLGAKKFYGKFGAGCIDHINIKTLQTILLKVALVLGVEIHPGVEFKDIIEPTDDHGWRATFNPPNIENLSKCDFDVIVGADGKKNVLPGFKQLELRGSLAIGITCNFINSNTPEETNCKEISGISYQFKPAFFDEMKAKHGVELENIVYYKDETHYFVMTARKNSLLNQGVLLKDSADPALLCQSSNVNIEKLADYTCKAVRYSTTLTKLEFKKLANGKPDIALFDFTSLKKADSASRILERNKKKLILALVGDSLIEPFWPTGSGCGRGVLSALDVAWMVRQFALNYPPLVMLRERENVFKLLSASTHDNMQKNYSSYTIDPKTRYPALDVKKITNLDSLKSLYDTDDLSADLTLSSPTLPQKSYLKKKTAVDRRKSGGSSATRPSGKIVAGKTKRKLERQESKSHRHEEKKLSIKDKKNFFEEHNKKMGMGTEVEKPKRQTLPSNDFSGLEGIDEDIHESDDEVLVDEPVAKKKIEDTATSKRTGHKEILDTSKGRSMKRTPSKDGAKKSTSKSLKRQQSKDGEISEPSTDEVPVVKKKIFQAKGGGLKSKSRGESRKSSERLKSTSEKKSTIRRKSRKSAGSSSEVEASRYSSFNSFDSTCSDLSKKSSRNNSTIERRLLNRKSEMRRVSGGSIVKRRSLSKKPTFLEKPGKSKILEYVKLFEENCGGVKSYKRSSSNSSLGTSKGSLCSLSSISKGDLSTSDRFNLKKDHKDSQSCKSDVSVESSLAVVDRKYECPTNRQNTNTVYSCEVAKADDINEICFNESSQIDHMDIELTENYTGSASEQSVSTSIHLKSDYGSKNNLLGSFSNNSMNSVSTDRKDSSTMDASFGKDNLQFASICSAVSLPEKNNEDNQNDQDHNIEITQPTVLTDTDMSQELLSQDHMLDAVSDLSGEPILPGGDSAKEQKNKSTKRTGKVRRSSSIRRSKYGKLDESMRSRWSPHASVMQDPQVESIPLQESVQPDKKPVKRSVSKRAAQTKVIKTIVKSYDLRKQSTNSCSDLSDTSLSTSSIHNNTILSKSTRHVKNDKRNGNTSRIDNLNKNPVIQSDKSEIKSLSHATNHKSVSTKNPANLILPSDQLSTQPIPRKTRYSNIRSAYAQNTYTPVRRPTRSSGVKTASHPVESVKPVSRKTPSLSIKTQSKQVSRSNQIVITVTDETDSTQSLDIVNNSLESGSESSDMFTINYDAKHSPVLKRSRKRRNLQSSSIIRKKSSKKVSPSRQLLQRRKKASAEKFNVSYVSEERKGEKYPNITTSISDVTDSDLITSINDHYSGSNHLSPGHQLEGKQKNISPQKCIGLPEKENKFSKSATCISDTYDSDITICTSLSQNFSSSDQNDNSKSIQDSSITTILSSLSSCSTDSKDVFEKTDHNIPTDGLAKPQPLNTSLLTNISQHRKAEKYNDTTSILSGISDLTICTPLSQRFDSSNGEGGTEINYDDSKSLAESSITTMLSSLNSSTNDSKVLCEISDPCNRVDQQQTPWHIDSLYSIKKENRTVAVQQGTKKRIKAKNVMREVTRGHRICPLGKSSINKSPACGAVSNFLGKTNSRRRHSSILNSIMEE